MDALPWIAAFAFVCAAIAAVLRALSLVKDEPVVGVDLAKSGSDKTAIAIANHAMQSLGRSGFIDESARADLEAFAKMHADMMAKMANPPMLMPDRVFIVSAQEVIARQNAAAARFSAHAATQQRMLSGGLHGMSPSFLAGGVSIAPGGISVLGSMSSAPEPIPSIATEETQIVPRLVAGMGLKEIQQFAGQIRSDLAAETDPGMKEKLGEMLKAAVGREDYLIVAAKLAYNRAGLEPDLAAIRSGITAEQYIRQRWGEGTS